MTHFSQKILPISNNRYLSQRKLEKIIPSNIPIQESTGAGENAFKETVHVSPSKLEKIVNHPSLEKMYTIDSLNSLEKYNRDNVEKIIANAPNDNSCVCKICTCGLHHCPARLVRYKFPGLIDSSYHKQYKGSPTSPVYQFSHDKDKPKFFGDDRVNNISSYMQTYIPHPVDYSPRSELKPSPNNNPFINNTTYNHNYVDWGSPGKNLSHKDHSPYKPIKYYVQSKYQEDFAPIDLNYRSKPMPKKDNFPLDQKFSHSSCYDNNFINHNLKKPEIVIPKYNFVLSQTFPGQFRSTTNKDFDKKKGVECEVKKYEGVEEILKRSSLYYNPTRSQYYY